MTWLLIFTILLLLGAAGYMGWLLMNCQNDDKALEKDKQHLQSQVDSLKKELAMHATTAEKKPATCTDMPTAAFKDNIKAALNSKNTAAFATYTSNPVRFVIAASEKGDDETPDEAAVSLQYTHSATGPWNFSLPAATIDHYDAGFYTSYFDDNTYVGRSADGMVVAFDFNCDGKISQIFVAANEGLL